VKRRDGYHDARQNPESEIRNPKVSGCRGPASVKQILVLFWPRLTAMLVVQRWRRSEVLEHRELGEEATPRLPAAWLEAADEIRVAVNDGVFFRPLALEGLSGAALAEAARFAAEPLLPISIDELQLSLITSGSRRRPRIMAAALRSSDLARIRQKIEELLPPDDEASRRPPVSWIGPVLAALEPRAQRHVRGSHWAARADAQGWADAQSARDGALAMEALMRRGATPASGWEECDAAACGPDVARAPQRASWQRAPGEERAGWRRQAPWFLLAASFLIVLLAFGLRLFAANARLAAAEQATREAFSEALPNTPARQPSEQIRARLAELRRRRDALGERVAKTGSALRFLTALESAMEPGEIMVNDLDITPDEFKVLGSGANNDVIEKAKQGLAAALAVKGEPAPVLDVEIRRSSAGLGFDFTLKGKR